MRTFISILFMFAVVPAWSETVYIDDKVQVGLHEEKNVDSPIQKLLPSGTALEIIKRDTPLSQVREPGGNTGWVDNRYLADTAPGRAQLQAAQNKISTLESELNTLKSAGTTTRTDNPKDADLLKENKGLTELLKSERLKVGELQAQTAELRNKLGKSGNSEMQAQIDALLQEKIELQKRIEAMESQPADPEQPVAIDLKAFDWRKMLIFTAIGLLTGLFAGIYLMDWSNRRRHGGFRV